MNISLFSQSRQWLLVLCLLLGLAIANAYWVSEDGQVTTIHTQIPPVADGPGGGTGNG